MAEVKKLRCVGALSQFKILVNFYGLLVVTFNEKSILG
jgi:hypothetical protein